MGEHIFGIVNRVTGADVQLDQAGFDGRAWFHKATAFLLRLAVLLGFKQNPVEAAFVIFFAPDGLFDRTKFFQKPDQEKDKATPCKQGDNDHCYRFSSHAVTICVFIREDKKDFFDCSMN